MIADHLRIRVKQEIKSSVPVIIPNPEYIVVFWNANHKTCGDENYGSVVAFLKYEDFEISWIQLDGDDSREIRDLFFDVGSEELDRYESKLQMAKAIRGAVSWSGGVHNALHSISHILTGYDLSPRPAGS